MTRLSGFRQRLLLLVVIIIVGFFIVIGASLFAFHQQNLAASTLTKTNQQLLTLEQLRSQIKAVPSASNAAFDTESVRQSVSPLLERLNEESAEFGPALTKAFDSWASSIEKVQREQQILGTDNDSGLRNDLFIAIDYLKANIHTHMVSKFNAFVDALGPMLENSDPASVELVNSEYQTFDEFFDYIGMREDFDDLLTDTRIALDGVTASVLQLYSSQSSAHLSLDHLQSLLQQQETLLTQQRSVASNQASKITVSVRIAMLILGAGVMAVCSFILWLIWRHATSSLANIVTTLEKIADGDLTQQLPVNLLRNDDFDRLGNTVNHLTEKLSKVLSEVQSASHALNDRSSELHYTLNKQSEASEMTERELCQVSEAIDQITITVEQMALSLDETNQLSKAAREESSHGGEIINNALGSMEGLSNMFDSLRQQLDKLDASSKDVDGVTAMIGGLAEQTNLLALNAAIESARAGEAGRGFSVVADEVRALAEKTVAATANINDITQEMQKQVNQLLQNMQISQNQVASSRNLGDEAIVAMQRITQTFQQVNDRNQQQAVSIEEVATTAKSNSLSLKQTVQRVSDVTQTQHNIKTFAANVTQYAKGLYAETSRFRCH